MSGEIAQCCSIETMSDARLTDVESALAFLEKTVQDLSDVARRQQEELDTVNVKLQVLTERVERVETPEGEETNPPDEKPPHY